MSDTRFLARANELGIGESRWVRQRAPAFQLVAQGVPEAKGSSKFGGLPDLPDGVPWPRWDPTEYCDARDARYPELAKFNVELRATRPPLHFVAQLNLADLPGPLPAWLPADGLLSFFYKASDGVWGYCPSHRGGWQVLYTPSGQPLELHEPPDDLDEFSEELGETTLEEVGVVPYRYISPAFPRRNEYDSMSQDSGEALSMLERESRLWGVPSRMRDEPHHQVGGFGRVVQNVAEEELAMIRRGHYLGGGYPELTPDQWDAVSEEAKKWHLLLQIVGDELDDTKHWWWGHWSTIAWWIHEDDARDGRWDQAWFRYECT